VIIPDFVVAYSILHIRESVRGRAIVRRAGTNDRASKIQAQACHQSETKARLTSDAHTLDLDVDWRR
jgi:hypothetical protein